MTPSEWANWVIAIFTIVLAIATIIYAIITAKMLSSSNKSQELLEKQITESQKQVEALKELSNAIRAVGPSVIAAQAQKEKREKLAEMQKKDNPQRRVLTER